jgi:Immunity protein Imm1
MMAEQNKWTVTDGDEVRHVASLEELEATLDAWHERFRKRRRLVALTSPAGPKLLIGLGGTESVLQLRSGEDPPYLATIGRIEEQGVESFLYEGGETEIERRRLIPIEGARHAVALFFETGRRPDNVVWEQV